VQLHCDPIQGLLDLVRLAAFGSVVVRAGKTSKKQLHVAAIVLGRRLKLASQSRPVSSVTKQSWSFFHFTPIHLIL